MHSREFTIGIDGKTYRARVELDEWEAVQHLARKAVRSKGKRAQDCQGALRVIVEEVPA